MRSTRSCRASARAMAAAGLCCALGLACCDRIAPAADRVPGNGVIDLAERLKVGLGVQAPADVAFCDAVARRVIEGRLPRHLVDGTYTWSLQRGKKYPFPAFEHVIRIKAARLGVTF
jgi:hypothetical protein